MHIILERDNGRTEQIIADLPGVTVTLIDTGSDQTATDEPLVTLPSGETGAVSRLRVITDPDSVQAILSAVGHRAAEGGVTSPPSRTEGGVRRTG